MKNLKQFNIEMAYQYGLGYLKLSETEQEKVFFKILDIQTETHFEETWQILRKNVFSENHELVFLILMTLNAISHDLLRYKVRNIQSSIFKQTIGNIISQGKENPLWSDLTDMESKELKTMILSSCLESMTQPLMRKQS